MNENNRIKIESKPMKKSSTMVAATIVAICAVLTIGIQTQISHQALAETYSATSNGMTAGPSASSASSYVSVSPKQSTNKEFWINTVHLDGMTNIHAAVKCDTCNQNTPLHPAEQPPLNSTIPTGGGFRLTDPNKVGAWDFRSFTFAPDQIVVNQGDKVTLHFIGVQGAHHIITVDGLGTFPLMRGQIHTVSFIAKNPGTINYSCHLHLPNMVGQILVLPKSA
jgi:plastocyanin